MIDGIVVNQGRQVNQLEHGRICSGAGLARAVGLAGEQEERGAKHLPLHQHQVLIDAPEEIAVDGDDTPHLVGDACERLTNGSLDFSKSCAAWCGHARGDGH